ncbi:ABC transporter transmembrane domain-containing protein [Buchananella felis]|uniref:ABC transporter transmembrane domain-containing protein n=1 Tax=Buchananella felis TaxID=3231492 RepID=UPI003527563C
MRWIEKRYQPPTGPAQRWPSTPRGVVWHAIRQSWPTILAILFFALLSHSASALTSVALGKSIDAAAAYGFAGPTFAWVGGLLVLIFAAAVFGGGLEEFFWVITWIRTSLLASRSVGHHVANVGPATAREQTAGEVTTTVSSDVNRLADFVSAIPNLIGVNAVAVLVTVLMFRDSPQLALLVAIGLPTQMAVLALLSKPLQSRQELQRKADGDLTTLATDTVAGLRILRGIGGEEMFSAGYRAQSQKVRQAGVKVAAPFSLLVSLQTLLPGLFTALVIWRAAHLAVAGQLTVGQLITFVGFTVYLAFPLQQTSQFVRSATRGWVAAKRVAAIMAVEPLAGNLAERSAMSVAPTAALGAQMDDVPPAAPAQSAAPLAGPGDDAVRDGSTGTAHAAGTGEPAPAPAAGPHAAGTANPNGMGAVTHHLAGIGGELVDHRTGVRIQPGKLTVVVSPDPSASAALAARLARLDDSQGPVTLNGTDLRELSLPAVRAAIVHSHATAQLFAGSLRSNLDASFADVAPYQTAELVEVEREAEHSGEVSRDRVQPEHLPVDAALDDALAAADAHDVRSSLPRGLGGTITEKGRSLSGGQRQRVALARTLATNAPVLILVEPTSAVDAHTEMRIAAALRSERAGRTTVVISASPLVLEQAEQVIFLPATALAAAAENGQADSEPAEVSQAGVERAPAGTSATPVVSTHRELLAAARRGEADGLAYRDVVSRSAGDAPEGSATPDQAGLKKGEER